MSPAEHEPPRLHGRTESRFWWVVGLVGALALWVSSGVYAATATGLAGPDEPEAGASLPEYVESYLAYRRALFPFEQWVNWNLALALLAIGVLAWGLYQARGVDPRMFSARFGALALASGALVSAVAQVASLGAVERVFVVSEIAFFDPGSLATIVDVVGRTDDYVENLGALMMAAGLVALGITREAGGVRSRVFQAASWALAVLFTAVAATSFAASPLTDPILLLVGFLAAPVWMLVAAHTLARRSASISRRRADPLKL